MEVCDAADYFESYEDLEVHKTMLEDSVRNQAYRKAIMDNKDSIQGKVVMDVGSGTGILSVYCAQAGASVVYAVEASETYKITMEIARENGFENVIQVIHDRVENVILPGDTKVDVIVSEWMGFYLLHEAMLDSVLVARDKFLKPGGLMFPDSATIYAAPCSVPDLYSNWEDCDGVSMKTFASLLRKKSLLSVTTLPNECLLSIPESIFWFDLNDITKDQLETISFKHIFVSAKPGKYQGVCFWFTCTFPSTSTEPVILSTDPDDPPTHWKQTTIGFPEEDVVEIGEPICVDVELKKSDENDRRYKISVGKVDPNEIEHPEYCNCYMTKCILAKAVLEKYENNEFS